MSYVPYSALPRMQQQRAMQFGGMQFGGMRPQQQMQQQRMAQTQQFRPAIGNYNSPARLQAQAAYDSSLPGGSAQAYDKMRYDQNRQQGLDRDIGLGLVPTGTTTADLDAQNKAAYLANYGPPADLNKLRAAGHVGGPVGYGGAEAYMRRTNPVMNPGMSQSFFRPLASEMGSLRKGMGY